jgi:hypothetical protein
MSRDGTILVVLMTALAPALAQQPTVSDPALGLAVGPRIAEVSVPATGVVRTAVLIAHAGQGVIVVVRGEFVYSQRPGAPLGRQDAKYRWGSRHIGRYCLCDDPNRDSLSLVIDGRYREPEREQFDSHTYVYAYRVGDGGAVAFQIRDDNYSDNTGALGVTIYERR